METGDLPLAVCDLTLMEFERRASSVRFLASSIRFFSSAWRCSASIRSRAAGVAQRAFSYALCQSLLRGLLRMGNLERGDLRRDLVRQLFQVGLAFGKLGYLIIDVRERLSGFPLFAPVHLLRCLLELGLELIYLLIELLHDRRGLLAIRLLLLSEHFPEVNAVGLRDFLKGGRRVMEKHLVGVDEVLEVVPLMHADPLSVLLGLFENRFYGTQQLPLLGDAVGGFLFPLCDVGLHVGRKGCPFRTHISRP